MTDPLLVQPDATETPPEPPLLPVAACWAALHTHSRSEKVVAERLAALSVPHFLPLTEVRRTYGTRVRTSELPLFPGYVFFDLEAGPKERVLSGTRVVRIVPSPDPVALEEELTNIARLLQVQPALKRIDFGPPGSPVEVLCGPFEGMRGELVRYEGKARLVVRIPYLSLATEVSIEEAWLKPAPLEESI